MAQVNTHTAEQEQHYDDMMREIEEFDLSALFAVVPGSQLHNHIKQAGTHAIDEG